MGVLSVSEKIARTDTMSHYWHMTDEDWIAKIDRGLTEPRMTRALRLVTKHLDVRDARGFDFGCGEGVLMRRLEERGAVMDGCDPSEVLIERAGPRGSVGDVSYLRSLPAGLYDFFLMFQVVSFLTRSGEFDEALTEAYRLLKPEGLLLITIANGRVMAQNARRPHVADPKTFNDFLGHYGFIEVDHMFDNCLRTTAWRCLHPSRRNERTMDDAEIAHMSEAHKCAKCAMYLSLSRKPTI